MKKTVNKLLVWLLAGMMCVSTAACGGAPAAGTSTGGNSGNTSVGGDTSIDVGTSEEEIPGVTNPYSLTVFNFDGGYGHEWLDAAISRYKKVRAGKEFTVDGVTYDGVDFKVTNDKTLMSAMATSGTHYDIWLEEQVPYNQLIRSDKTFAKMTDVMTEENPYEPGVTLESKLSAQQQEFYKVTKDGETDYYGLPHYAGYVGIVYNKYYFDGYGWYLKDGYNKADLVEDIDACFTDDATARTAGPDGMKGTEDDGLPTTYEEFYALCDVITGTRTPISWTGKHREGYLSWFTQAMMVNHEGLEQGALNFSFDGTAENLVVFNEDGSVKTDADGNIVTESVAIDAATNGYELGRQAGKYYAFKFLETIMERGYHTDGAVNPTYEQTTAQEHFIDGSGLDALEDMPAMLLEGVWWEMEAAGILDAMQQSSGQDYRQRYAFMPLPCATEAEAAERAEKAARGENYYTLMDTHNTICAIGKEIKSEVYPIAKDFIQFIYTDESLAEFSKITNTTKAVKYTMSEEDKAQLSSFGRSLLSITEKADVVYGYAKTSFYQQNEMTLINYNQKYSARYTSDSSYVTISVDEFRKGKTAAEYFRGHWIYEKYKWDHNEVIK